MLLPQCLKIKDFLNNDSGFISKAGIFWKPFLNEYNQLIRELGIKFRWNLICGILMVFLKVLGCPFVQKLCLNTLLLSSTYGLRGNITFFYLDPLWKLINDCIEHRFLLFRHLGLFMKKTGIIWNGNFIYNLHCM